MPGNPHYYVTKAVSRFATHRPLNISLYFYTYLNITQKLGLTQLKLYMNFDYLFKSSYMPI
jgi:hypothetical protein